MIAIRINNLNPRYIKVDGDNNQGIVMTKIIMIRENIKIDIDQIAEIEGHHSEIEVCTDKIIIGEDHNMAIIIEVTLEEMILEQCKITGIKILEVEIEGIAEVTTLEEVEEGTGTDKIQVISVEMTEVVVAGQDQVHELVLIETELDALSAGKDCPTLQTEKEPEQIQQMSNLDEKQTALKVLATDTYDNLIRPNSADDTIIDHLNM